MPYPEIRGVAKLQTPNFGEGEEMVPFERALVSSYKPSIHIISVSATVCPKFYIAVLGGGCEPPILEAGEAVGGQG